MVRQITLASALVSIVTTVQAAAVDITHTNELEAFVDGIVESGMDEHNVAGMVVAIVKDGQVLLSKGYGYADVEKKLPVDPARTMFRIGSVTKLFTWTALTQLEEQGRIHLDPDVNDYLTSIEIPQTFPEPITIRNLMTHTGGFEDRLVGLFSLDASSVKPYGEILSVDLPERVRPPGWVSSYSNHGVGVAGLIVEDVAGTSWADYVEANIMEPLGMRNSTPYQPVPEALAADMSKGYQFEAGRFVEKPFEFVPLGAVGGISASALDMLKFAMAHLNDGAYPGGRILGQDATRRMREALFKPYPELNGWLHGFADYSRNDTFIYGHNGGTFYFFTEFALFPEEKLGIFMSTNTAGAGQVNAALFRELVDRYFPVGDAPDPVAVPFDLAPWTGTYATFRHPFTTAGKLLRLVATVQVGETDDDKLVLSGRGDHPTYWTSLGDGVFQNAENRQKLKFVADPAGALLFIGAAGGSFYKLTGIHTPAFQFGALGIAALLLGWALIAWPIQRLRGARRSGAEHQGRIVGWLVALSLYVAVLGIAANVSQDVVYGVPLALRVLEWVPVATLVLLLLYVVVLARMIRDPAIAVSVRIFHVGLALSAGVVCWLLSYWNLMGG
jgi:CubicO group peptidase (beta-lactamase class C family)